MRGRRLDASAPPPDGWLTLLRCRPGKRASKTYRRDGDTWQQVSAFDAGGLFSLTAIKVTDVTELAADLRRIASDPMLFVVRGRRTREYYDQIERGQFPDSFARRSRDRGDGHVPSLEDAPNPVVVLDSDDFVIPAGLTIERDAPEIARRFIVEKLPEEFHDVACVVHLSSSAGLLPGNKFKAHLFFLAHRGATRLPIADYLRAVSPKAAGGVDVATLGAVQPIYTAAPSFLPEGTSDPLEDRRIFVLPGRPRVALGSDDDMRRIALEARMTPRRGGPKGGARKGSAKAAGGALKAADAPEAVRQADTPAAAIALLGDGDGLAGFHEPLRRAAWLTARNVVARNHTRDDEAFLSAARAAIAAAPKTPERDVASYGDDYLRRSLEGAYAAWRAAARRAWSGDPGDGPRPGPVEDARRELAGIVADAMTAVRSWLIDGRGAPPAHGVRVTVGTGKTEAAVFAIGLHIDFARALALPHRVVVFVPTHRLAAELAARLQRTGVSAAIWRGLDAEDPDAAPGRAGKPVAMCLNPDAAADAMKAGLPVQRAACGGGDGPRCPQRGVCGWWRQRAAAGRADVVVAAAASAFHELPAAMQRHVGLYVFDEAWWQVGLGEEEVTLDALSAAPETQPVLARGVADPGATQRLHDLRGRLRRLLAAHPEESPIAVKDLRRAGLSAWGCREAARLEWRRVPRALPIVPGMNKAQRAEALSRPGANAAAMAARMAAMWLALAGALSSRDEHTARLALGRKATSDGEVRVIRLRLRRPLAAPIPKAPTLLLDAMLPAPIVRRWFPDMEVHGIAADAPHQHVTLLPGPWGKTSLLPSEKTAPDEARRREARIAELRDVIGALGRRGRTLLVTYKALTERFADLPGVETAHFNAVAGRDVWGGVRWLVVLGAPNPSPQDIAALAARLTGEPVAQESETTLAGVALRGRGAGLVQARRYRNPTAEDIRAAVADAEIVQAVGRARGVNRTAENPVGVLVFASAAPAGLVVDRILPWQEAQPCSIARMALRGVVLESPADARAVWPDLFASIGAAKMAWQRWRVARDGEQLVTNPYDYSFIGVRDQLHVGRDADRHLVGVTYRPIGERRAARRALIDPTMLDDARARIAAAVGPLATWQPDAERDIPRSPRRSRPPRDRPRRDERRDPHPRSTDNLTAEGLSP